MSDRIDQLRDAIFFLTRKEAPPSLLGFPLYKADTTWFDFFAVASSLIAFGALVAAIYGLRQNTKSRNLATVIDFTAKLSAEWKLGFDAKVFGDQFPPEKIHVYQMLHLIESSAFIINKQLVTGSSKDFLLSWLAMEIPHMDSQPIYQQMAEETVDEEMSELHRLRPVIAKNRARFQKGLDQQRRAKALARLKRRRDRANQRHWDNMFDTDLRSKAAHLRVDMGSYRVPRHN